MIFKEFNITNENGQTSHIINGHVPVKVKMGETPVKANGKVIVIDGGFCRAYHKKTGIAGYTLVYNSRGLRLMAHQPFTSVKKSLKENKDIESITSMVELTKTRCMVYDTDKGKELKTRISDLERLFLAYQAGLILQTK
jgi:fructose-1,6-bisphosphatase-3